MVPRPRPWLADSDECGLARLQGSSLTVSGSNQPNRADALDGRHSSAPLGVSKFCASTHLRREIECLVPDGLCFLSKNIGFPVCTDLLPRWSVSGRVEFGEVATVVVNDKPVQAVATAWPGRGHEALTTVHVQSLFCRLGLPTWES